MSPEMIARMILGCSVCYGAAGHPLTKGLNMGILSLLLVVTFVLIFFATFFFQLRAKSKNTHITL